jgi:hypothetical protein
MQKKLRIVGKEGGNEEGIKGLGRKETKSEMDRNGKLVKGCCKQVSLVLSPTALCLDYTQHTTLRAPPTSALVSLAYRLEVASKGTAVHMEVQRALLSKVMLPARLISLKAAKVSSVT